MKKEALRKPTRHHPYEGITLLRPVFSRALRAGRAAFVSTFGNTSRPRGADFYSWMGRYIDLLFRGAVFGGRERGVGLAKGNGGDCSWREHFLRFYRSVRRRVRVFSSLTGTHHRALLLLAGTRNLSVVFMSRMNPIGRK